MAKQFIVQDFAATKAANELAAEVRNLVQAAVEKAICCRVQFKPS